jgi:hypothetical protein
MCRNYLDSYTGGSVELVLSSLELGVGLTIQAQRNALLQTLYKILRPAQACSASTKGDDGIPHWPCSEQNLQFKSLQNTFSMSEQFLHGKQHFVWTRSSA